MLANYFDLDFWSTAAAQGAVHRGIWQYCRVQGGITVWSLSGKTENLIADELGHGGEFSASN